jgi:hypothetical protein
MRTIATRMAIQAPTRRPRKSCSSSLNQSLLLHDSAYTGYSAGFTGAFIDREAETRGMNEFDREKAKHAAREQTEQAYSDNYQ